MDSLIDRLQHQTDELDTTVLDPDRHLGSVMRRGQRYRAVTSTLGALGATLALAGSAVALPHVVEVLQGPTQPTVIATPDGAPAPTVDPAPAAATEPAVDATQPAQEAAPTAAPAEPSQVIDAVAPSLEVLEPADGATVASAKVTFGGTTEPGARVTVGGYEATVDETGRWSILLIAAEGGNQVTFEATDGAGNTTSRTISVTYRPPGATTSGAKDTTKDVTASTTKQQEQPQPGEATTLTASQQSAVLTAAPHKNTYWGTAAPGVKVAVVSEHGTGYGWADDAGQWQVLVDFDPPGGETSFPVTVKLYHQPEVARAFQLTTVAQDVAAFTAGQQLAAVPVASPTNVYSGTGEPGHEVLVWTELHGQVTTVVGADGTWQVALTYADVAVGDTFAVKARDLGTGAKHFFEVTVTG